MICFNKFGKKIAINRDVLIEFNRKQVKLSCFTWFLSVKSFKILFFISGFSSVTKFLNKFIKIWKDIRYNIDHVKSQNGLIKFILIICSNIGEVIGIGIRNQIMNLYSVIKKYKNRMNTEKETEIRIPGDALKIIEIKDEADSDAPIVKIKYGIALLIGIFIL